MKVKPLIDLAVKKIPDVTYVMKVFLIFLLSLKKNLLKSFSGSLDLYLLISHRKI